MKRNPKFKFKFYCEELIACLLQREGEQCPVLKEERMDKVKEFLSQMQDETGTVRRFAESLEQQPTWAEKIEKE